MPWQAIYGWLLRCKVSAQRHSFDLALRRSFGTPLKPIPEAGILACSRFKSRDPRTHLMMLQANPNKIKTYQVDLAPGSSINLSNQNGYPYLSAQAPGRSVTVANVRLTFIHCSPDACVERKGICRPARRQAPAYFCGISCSSQDS
jgi:hypothetical protein